MHGLNEFLSAVNAVLWGPVPLCLYFFTGLFLTVRTGFFQFIRIRLWMSRTLFSIFRDISVTRSSDKGAISQFATFTSTLAACVGTGNIVGVATAIASGGPGAVFWMWIAALFSMATAFAENILGIRYRLRNARGEYVGGPMFYIGRGIHSPRMASLYALFCVFSSIGIGCMTQANAIADAAEFSFAIPPAVSGILLVAVCGLCIAGGIRRISSLTEKIVPVMSVAYFALGLYVLAANAARLPEIFMRILSEALSAKAASGGALGFGIVRAMRYGTARGVFSNEAGLGTSAIINAASDNPEPVIAGMWGILQVFIDTILLCSVTAFVLLLAHTPAGDGGINAVAFAFSSLIGGGEALLCAMIAIFAFTTILGWSYHGSMAFEYLLGSHSAGIYRTIYIAAAFAGSVFPLSVVWELSDALNALMAFPNLIAILLLSGEVRACMRLYVKKEKQIKNTKKKK